MLPPLYKTLHCLSPAGASAGHRLAAAMQQLLPSCSALPQHSTLCRSSSSSTRPKGEAPAAGPGSRTRSVDQAAAAGETSDTEGRVQVSE